MPVRKKAPEDLTAKKALALEVIRRLKAEYPDAGCTLDYDHAWQLLVSVRLAAQCTDARVNIVVEELFAKYPSVAALAAAEPEDIEAIVKPCGLGHSKARDISACMRMLRDQYNCRVPNTFEELLALPGVGRKSANLIMGDVFGKPAIVTDTHCIRLCNKIGLVDGIKEPKGGDGAMEDHPAGGRQRPLPPLCDAWPCGVQRPQAGMRKMLFERHLPHRPRSRRAAGRAIIFKEV